MNYKEYTEQAVKTESTIEEFSVNPALFTGALQIYIAIGNILDQIKKNAYYDKDYNRTDLINEFTNIVQSLDQVKNGITQIDDKTTINVDTRTTHGIIGIATESVELVEALAKHVTCNDLDVINIMEEIGDLQWYQALLMHTHSSDMEQLLDTNIKKLKYRYPNKFTSEDAINRDLDAERQILEE